MQFQRENSPKTARKLSFLVFRILFCYLLTSCEIILKPPKKASKVCFLHKNLGYNSNYIKETNQACDKIFHPNRPKYIVSEVWPFVFLINA